MRARNFALGALPDESRLASLRFLPGLTPKDQTRLLHALIILLSGLGATAGNFKSLSFSQIRRGPSLIAVIPWGNFAL
jgi:hypothetical protein